MKKNKQTNKKHDQHYSLEFPLKAEQMWLW